MASGSRNFSKPSSVQGFDSSDVSNKMQSSTLKRQPSPDWSKTDLLRLLSYFEGELQARDITIATLKADKAKQLLYQAKYGRFGLGDPFVALQRDAEGKNDAGFDEAAIKSMYDNQLAQLENLIATQRKAQLKMREQLGSSEKRFHKVCTELEEEKQKHAQDTAQGDDVTYMLEKERERLKAEIDFEKSQNKKLEKDLKKTLASLEDERANAARHKQVAIMLIKERKKLIEDIIAENQLRDEAENALSDEKSKTINMAEGLEKESKRSLKMEVAMEKQNSQFDSERESLRLRLHEEEIQTNNLRMEVARLSKQLETLQQQMRNSASSPSSIHIRSSASPARVINPPIVKSTAGGQVASAPPPLSQGQSVSSSFNNPYNPQLAGTKGLTSAQYHLGPGSGGIRPGLKSSSKVVDGGRIGSSSPEREVIFRPDASAGGPRRPGPSNMRIGPVGASDVRGGERLEVEVGSGGMAKVVNVSPGSSATVTTHGGGKISFHVGGGSAAHQTLNSQAQRKVGQTPLLQAGRGVPPPIPPNKPNLVMPPGSKPSPPPKASFIGQSQGKDSSNQSPYSNPHAVSSSSPSQRGAVQIPVNYVGGSSSVPSQLPAQPVPKNVVASVRTQVRETSPSAVRKNSQYVVGCPPHKDVDIAASSRAPSSTTTSSSITTTTTTTTLPLSPQPSTPEASLSSSPSTMEFLDPEMAHLHQLLASMTTAEASESDSHVTKASADTGPWVSSTETIITSSSSSSTFSASPLPPTNNHNNSTPAKNPPSTHGSTASSPVAAGSMPLIKPSSQSMAARLSGKPAPVSVSVSVAKSTTEAQANTQNLSASFISLPQSPTQVIPPNSNVSNNDNNYNQNVNSPNKQFSNVSFPSNSQQLNSTSTDSSVIKPGTGSSSRANDASYSKKTQSAKNTLSDPDLQKSTMRAQPSSQQNQLSSQHPVTLAVSVSSVENKSNSPTTSPVDNTKTSPASFHKLQTSANNSGPQFPLAFLNSIPAPTPKDLLAKSALHRLAGEGNVQALQQLISEQNLDVNLILSDGSTALHCAVENNQEACVKHLLENGARPSSLREDRITPLHLAAVKGYAGCTRLLLNKGAAVNLSAAQSQTPLHLAVKRGHLECCQMLLRHGAHVLYRGQDNLTSIHYAVQSNQPVMLQALLERLKLNGTHRDSDTAHQLVAIVDSSGWSVTHMAAALPNQDCLIKLAESLPLDFSCKDKEERSVKEVASPKCQHLLVDIDRPSSPVIKVQVELQYFLAHSFVSSAQLGVLDLSPGISWQAMEERLQAILKSYLAQLDVGLKTRRISRLDSDMNWLDKDFSLGLTMNNIKHFEMGYYKWTPGMQTDTSPYLILCNNEQKKVTIIVDDSDNMSDLIAFDVLHPVFSITNYLRLVEQYKSIIFYGPAGSGKSYLANRLAQCIAAQENSQGRKPAIYQLSLQPGFISSSFINYLKQRNCVLSVNKDSANHVPILVLDNLEVVDIAQLFGELLDPMEYRGIGQAFCLRGGADGENGMHYLHDLFYVIGTMNKSRSLGVDLSVLPRFRWIQFRLDTEPLRGLLARHFLRRILNMYQGCLPPPDEPVFRAIEWVVCVWQRLNDSLVKLGLPEVVVGPCSLFKCPLESKDFSLIMEWIKNLWNQHISPKVRDAVRRGTGSEAPSDGQQKVANTALYVLMQRSIILSCPLVGQEKESYLAGFSGSNELDIPLKPSDGKSKANMLQQRKIGTPEQGVGSSNVLKQKSLTGSNKPDVANKRNGRGEQKTFIMGPSNIKRRSLSESSVNKAGQKEDGQDNSQSGISTASALSQAKVAKLEVKSSKLLNIPSSFRSFSQSDSTPPKRTETSALTQTPVKKGGRISPLLSLLSNKSSSPSISPKKSRSSENISSTDLYSGMSRSKSGSPFSFSLATPTSNLSSFKFLESPTSDSKSSPLLSQMPDFSIFNKPPSGKFVFMETPGSPNKEQKLQGRGKEERKMKEELEQEVWSRRTDISNPSQRQNDKKPHKL